MFTYQLASYPGHVGGGKSGPVSTVCACAKNPNEQAKKREYGQRVRDIERGVFTPLVLSTNGGMGKKLPHSISV